MMLEIKATVDSIIDKDPDEFSHSHSTFSLEATVKHNLEKAIEAMDQPGDPWDAGFKVSFWLTRTLEALRVARPNSEMEAVGKLIDKAIDSQVF